jgi:uncharacterized protein (TIGR02271 family)
MASTVIGFYDSESTAQQVVQDLHSSGFSDRAVESTMGSGNSSNLTSRLERAGAPHDEAERFARGVEQGGSLVTVVTDQRQADTAADIMQRYNPIDVEDLDEWLNSNSRGATGMTGTGMTSAGMTGAGATTGMSGVTDRADMTATTNMTDMASEGDVGGTAGMSSDVDSSTTRMSDSSVTDNTSGDTSIPIVEEQLRVGKRQVSKGGVRVRSYVTEMPVEEHIALRDETIHVDRRPVNQPLTGNEADLFRERSIELTETDEEPIVSKEARVVEEVVVSKDVGERTETVRDSVRHTDVDIQHVGDASNDSDFSSFDADFRQHHSANLSGNYTYEQSQPAYRYGHTLASDSRYQGQDWDTLEKNAKRDWEKSNKGTWKDFKDSVRYGWERARG